MLRNVLANFEGILSRLFVFLISFHGLFNYDTEYNLEHKYENIAFTLFCKHTDGNIRQLNSNHGYKKLVVKLINSKMTAVLGIRCTKSLI